MATISERLSISQFAELVGIDPVSLRSVDVDPAHSSVTLRLEPNMAQTSGTCPPLKDNVTRRPAPKRKGK